MKKLVLVCALAAFAFVGCKSNKTACPVEAEAAATEAVAEAPADSTVCPETGKVCEKTVESEQVCEEKAEAAK